MTAAGARGCDLSKGGGAATYWSPELRRRRADAAAARDHGGVDSGGITAFWHARVSEEGAGATADVSVLGDLDGEDCGGRAPRRRCRRALRRTREKRGKGAVRMILQKSPCGSAKSRTGPSRR